MEKIIPFLKEAKALPDFRLQLLFEDGVNGIIDLAIWKKKAPFKFWEEEKNFSSFKITTDKKIEWKGDIDMDPDAFYLKLVNKTFEEYAIDKQFLRYSH